jgi:PPOX class probable F420-dependent enzyme
MREDAPMDVDEARAFLREHHNAVLHTYRRDGSPQLSPITASVDPDGYANISSRETAIKVKNLARDPRAALCALTNKFYGSWLFVEGRCEIVSLPEAMEMLVQYYRSVAGEHPDWDEYRTAMERDRRVMLRISFDRVGPTVSG